jgi:pseudouridine synthase
MAKIRINKFLSDRGVCSRRGADEHILIGDVSVNGQVVKLGHIVDSESDTVLFKGKNISANKVADQIILAFYKPSGVVSTFSAHETPNLSGYFKDYKGLKYAGRLDKESEGLMILSNDGDLINEISHPKFDHTKEYLIYAEDEKGDNDYKKILSKMAGGVRIDGKLMKILSIDNFQKSGKRLRFTVTLGTGYNRQIRRMFAKMNIRIHKIIRLRVAKLKLSDISVKPGKYIKIDKKQII